VNADNVRRMRCGVGKLVRVVVPLLARHVRELPLLIIQRWAIDRSVRSARNPTARRS
jgi:hypothetical protein